MARAISFFKDNKMKFEQRYSDKIIERGEGYIDSVEYCIKINDTIYGQVQGSRKYKTEVDLKSFDGDCSCPYGTNCKHAVALYLIYKKGDFWDADDFIKNLDKMSHNELKEMILSKLQDNPDWIKKYNLRKSTNKSDLLISFKKNFSSELISEAEAVLPDLTFEQLIELHNYISKNYDELSEKILEENEDDEYSNGYDDYDDEEYDKELYDLNELISEIIVKRAISENKVDRILKNEYLRDEIIENAESFIKYKEKIKKIFRKHECLQFLINLKNPILAEIKNFVDDSDKTILYSSLEEKTELIKEIAKSLNDKTLLFSAALYEKDLKTIIENFGRFEAAINERHELINYLGEIIDIFDKNKLKNGEIARKLLNRHIGGRYNKRQLTYLASQISDFEFIKKNFKKENIETDVVLLERLAQIDKEKTLSFVKNKKDLLGRHWTDIIPLFSFLKKYYQAQTIKEYVRDNQDTFRTSSHLKKHLKEECGIFISQTQGNLIVEVKG